MTNAPRRATESGTAPVQPRRPRGIAVILALIAVAIAILIGLAVSSMRDSNVIVGDQIVRLSQTRLAGKTSVDLATFVVRNHTNVLDGNGVDVERIVYADKQIGSSVYSASIQDVTTGLSPTRSTVGVRINATARESRATATPPGPPAEGTEGASTSAPLVQAVDAVVRVPWPDAVARADIDLSEFALLASAAQPEFHKTFPPKIEIGANAEISVWRDAPLAVLGDPIVIGSSERAPNQVSISASARLNGVQVLQNGTFAQTADEFEEQLADGVRNMPADIHVPRLAIASSLSGAYASSSDFTLPYTHLNTLSPHQPHMHMRPPPGGRFTSFPLAFEGAVQPGQWRMVLIRGMSVQLSDCRWRFEVPTMLIVLGRLELLSGTCFEIGPRGALTIVALDGVMVNNSYIGPALGPNATWSTTGAQPYAGMGASRVMILEGGNPMGKRAIYSPYFDHYRAMGARADLSGGTNPTIVKNGTTISNGGAIVGEIYGPDSTIQIGTNCALYGRALANQITVSPGGRVFYDPQLDTGAGWLNPESGIWAGTGSVRPEVRSIELLTDEFLARFSSTTGLAVGPVGNGMLMTANVRDGGFVKRDMTTTVNYGVPGNGQTSGDRGPIPGTQTPVGIPAADYVFPEGFRLYGITRDFRGQLDLLGHRDFGLAAAAQRRWWSISTQLDGDGKPTATTSPLPAGASLRAISSPTTFATWFRDTPGQNVSFPYVLHVGRTASYGHTPENPRWVYNAVGGSLGIGRGDGYDDTLDAWPGLSERANSTWTTELGASFEYRQDKGQWLYMRASNDVLVYLNGRLLLDIAAQSSPNWRSINLNDVAASHGLRDGQTYRIQFFVAHRYSATQTDVNFWFNFPLISDPPPQVLAFPRLEEIKRIRDEVAAKFRSDTYAPLTSPAAVQRPRILGFTTGLLPNTSGSN